MPMLTASDFVDFARGMEVLLLGFMSVIFLTNFYHQGISSEFKRKFNYPAWLPAIIGCVQLAVALVNLNAFRTGDAATHSWIAQRLVALLMGGCFYTHMKLAKRPKDATGAAVFFLMSVLIATVDEKQPLTFVVPAHLCVAALGWMCAELISRMEPKQQVEREAGGYEKPTETKKTN